MDIAKVQAMVDKAFLRHDDDHIRFVFAQHCDGASMPTTNLLWALQEFKPGLDANELTKMMRALSPEPNDQVSYEQFQKLVNMESAIQQWAQTLPFANLAGEAISAIVSNRMDLRAVAQLTDDQIASISLGLVKGHQRLLTDHLRKLKAELKEASEERDHSANRTKAVSSSSSEDDGPTDAALLGPARAAQALTSQAGSLVDFLKRSDNMGIISLKLDKSAAPHGIQGFDVHNILQFRSMRSQWLTRDAVKCEEGLQDGGKSYKQNSVKQAFRRNGLIPEKKVGTSGYDWENGVKWTFDADTYSKYGAPSKVRQHGVVWGGGVASDVKAATDRMVKSFTCFLSGEIMEDPVIVPESGNSYERTFIQAHLLTHNTDPRTHMSLESKLVIRNHSLKESIEAFLQTFPMGA